MAISPAFKWLFPSKPHTIVYSELIMELLGLRSIIKEIFCSSFSNVHFCWPGSVFYLLLMEIVSKLNHKLHRARIKELNGNGNTSKCLSSALYLKLRLDLWEILQKHLKVLENSNLYRNGLFRLIPGIEKTNEPY